MTTLLALDLNSFSGADVSCSVAATPIYTNHFARAVNLTVRTIRRLALLEGVGRHRIEVYLGRSYPDGVQNRFCAHRDGKGHTGGVCLFRVPTEIVSVVEHAGVRIIKLLNERRKLCIANLAADARGPLPSSDLAVIYLTWRVLPRGRDIDKAGIDDVRDIAEEVSVDVEGEISEASLFRGLLAIKRPSDMAPVDWAA